MYVTQAIIADDPYMRLRVSACAAQQGCAGEGAGIDPDAWTLQWRKVWASSPGWDTAWESAIASDNPSPGSDPAVITDEQILSQVQSMMPFIEVKDNAPQMNPAMNASRDFVLQITDPLDKRIGEIRQMLERLGQPVEPDAGPVRGRDDDRDRGRGPAPRSR